MIFFHNFLLKKKHIFKIISAYVYVFIYDKQNRKSKYNFITYK